MGAAPAMGQPLPSDTLFQQGKALMDQGRIPEACQRFAESLALVRRGGTLLNLAVCREKQGLYATAVRLFQEAGDMANKDGRAKRAEFAAERVKSIESMLSWITVRFAQGAQVPGLAIQRDGDTLPTERWGSRQAVDPGAHTIVATAPGHLRFEVTVTVAPVADNLVVEIPVLAEEAASPVMPKPLPPTPFRDTAPRAPIRAGGFDIESAPTSRWHRPVGGIALGFGVAAVAAGSVLGAQAILDSRDGHRLCPNNTCPLTRDGDRGYEENQRAKRAALASDITIPVGLAAAGVGLYLLLFGGARRPSSSAILGGLESVQLVPLREIGATGVSFGGAW